MGELGIKFFKCCFEADSQIAALANKWDCPVVSIDSDFYILDIKKGLITLENFRVSDAVTVPTIKEI